MEKYFEVKKDSDFYKKYFDFVNMSDKVNELFKKFAKDNGIETKKYCQNTERLVIVPTQEDRIKFKGMFVQNSDTTGSRLFHIGEKIYGSIDNKCDADIELTDEFVEMKASEFWKIIEDSESK